MKIFKYSALSIIPFLIGIAIISPFKDVFYAGDEWSYAWAVKNLIETRTFVISDYQAAPALTQILWASFFVKIFGWTLSIVNISSIVLAFFGGLFFFHTLALLGFRYQTALTATVIVTVSPLYLGLSLSFMTDSIFTSLLLMASYFYVRAILKKSVIFSIFGGLFCAAAFLNRQIGIVLLIAYILALIFWFLSSAASQNRKNVIKIFLTGIFFPLGAFFLYLISEKNITQILVADPVELVKRFFNIPYVLIKSIIIYNFLITLLCPMLISFMISTPKEFISLKKSRFFLIIIGTALIAGPLIWILKFGVYVQGDIFQVNSKYGNNEIWNTSLWIGFNFLCIIPGTLMMIKIFQETIPFLKVAFISNIEKKFDTNPFLIAKLFIILCTVGLIFLTAAHINFFNNYFLPILPFMTICLLFILNNFKQNIFLSSGMTLILFSISILDIESHVRYVEASWRQSNILVSSGVKKNTVFSHPSWYGWKNINEIHDYMQRTFKEDPKLTALNKHKALNSISNAYDNAKIYIVGSKTHPLYFKFTPQAIHYKTLIRERELWILK